MKIGKKMYTQIFVILALIPIIYFITKEKIYAKENMKATIEIESKIIEDLRKLHLLKNYIKDLKIDDTYILKKINFEIEMLEYSIQKKIGEEGYAQIEKDIERT